MKKDSSKPKRGRNPYILFSNAKRNEVIAANPSMTPREIMKKLAKMWNEISAEERIPYEKQSKEENERSRIEMKAWNDKNHGEIQCKSDTKNNSMEDMWNEKLKELQIWYEKASENNVNKTPRKLRDPTRPKRSRNAYVLFSQTKRAGLKTLKPNLNNQEIMSELGIMWKSASEEERARFINLANEDSERYKTEMIAWKSKQVV